MIVKRVPKGTSAYQAAWIIESEDEDEVCLGWFLNVHYTYYVSQNVPLSSFLFFLELLCENQLISIIFWYTTSWRNIKKVKYHTPQKSVGGCSSPSPRLWAHRWRTTNVCDVWPVQRRTYGYLPSHQASPPIVWYQIIPGYCLVAEAHNNLPRVHSTAGVQDLNPWPVDYKSSVLTTRPPSHTSMQWPVVKWVWLYSSGDDFTSGYVPRCLKSRTCELLKHI